MSVSVRAKSSELSSEDSPTAIDSVLRCSICRTSEAAPAAMCTNTREPHHFCRECLKPYIAEVQEDDEARCIPCPMWEENAGECCDCTAPDRSVIRALQLDDMADASSNNDVQEWVFTTRHGLGDPILESAALEILDRGFIAKYSDCPANLKGESENPRKSEVEPSMDEQTAKEQAARSRSTSMKKAAAVSVEAGLDIPGYYSLARDYTLSIALLDRLELAGNFGRIAKPRFLRSLQKGRGVCQIANEDLPIDHSVYATSVDHVARAVDEALVLGQAISVSEFHRRKTLYFLKKIKETVSTILWNVFQAYHSRILSDFMAKSASDLLSWKDIENISLPKKALARRNDVLWVLEIDGMISRLKEKVTCSTTFPMLRALETSVTDGQTEYGDEPDKSALSFCFLYKKPESPAANAKAEEARVAMAGVIAIILAVTFCTLSQTRRK